MSLLVATLLALAPTDTANCKTASLAACTSAQQSDATKRHVVILSTGFAAADEATFWSEFDRIVTIMTDPSTAGTTWSAQKKDQLLFFGYFTAGGPIDSATAAYGAKIPVHPVRGHALSLDQDSVYSTIDQVRTTYTWLRPMGALVLFNYTGELVTANAAPPTFIQKSYGVAKMTRTDLDQRGAYIPVHELGHAGLNFLDEYTEAGFEKLDIHSVDVLTPLATLDNTWGGFVTTIANFFGYYTFRLSEILANNGNDNIATQRFPATVTTSGVTNQDYAAEGGMFFGHGTFHMSDNNIMWHSSSREHSPSQQQVIEQAFGGKTMRPNDRLRNAGPSSSWPATFGSTTRVMLADGDKRHFYHPTRTYNVQVAWQERVWKTCWAAIFPYPCHDDVWKYAETTVWNSPRNIQLKMTVVWGVANLVQKLACAAGFTQISSGDKSFRLCDQDVSTLASEFLPTLVYGLPYQEVAVPASQWMTTYFWRFRTDNGAYLSGYTGWSSFYRSL